ERGQDHVDPEHEQQAGRQPGVAADRARADQLGPAGLPLPAGGGGGSSRAREPGPCGPPPAGLARMPLAVLASRSRSAWVGYSETMLAAWLKSNTNRPSTQTVATTRSRRTARA